MKYSDTKEKRKLSLYWKIIITLGGIALVLNLLALSSTFCDFYLDNMFWLSATTYGRITGLFPFSLGEWLIVAGILLVVVVLISSVVLIFLRKKTAYVKYVKKLYKFFLAVFLVVVLIMTLNCSLLYGGSKMSLSGDEKKQEYTVDELENLRNMIVEKCNELAYQIERDEEGNAIYSGASKEPGEQMLEEAKASMRNLEEGFSRLRGFYPDAKPIYSSVFMTQTFTSGVYFPFSMEANYNDMMYVVNYPSVICHEYSHLKGYLFEDEANFIAYLACINSDDIFFQYSGYQGVLGYVDNSYYDSVSEERYLEQVRVDLLVWEDYIFLTPENWEVVEEESILDTEKVDEVSDAMTDETLKFFGVEEGIVSYDRVTELLLEYYSLKGEI